MSLDAHECPNGHLTYPGHPVCPECGEPQEDTVDLSDRTATVVTWTTSTATPPGMRQPNPIAIVEFDVGGEPVRALGGLVEGADVEIGDEVRPVYVAELREHEDLIRESESQEWDGYRFEPI